MELDKEQSPDEHGTENCLSSQPSPKGHCVHLRLDQGQAPNLLGILLSNHRNRTRKPDGDSDAPSLSLHPLSKSPVWAQEVKTKPGRNIQRGSETAG